MITKIAIENFKGIGERVEVELRPITLLFGANNAGKSSILQALHYAREVLERHNLDPDRTVAGGRYVDLGGFLGLVHGHERERPVTIGLDLSFGDRGFPHYEHDGRLFDELIVPCNGDDLLLSGPFSATIQATVCWSELLRGPFVRSFRLRFDGGDFAEITADPEGPRVVLTYSISIILCWRGPRTSSPKAMNLAQRRLTNTWLRRGLNDRADRWFIRSLATWGTNSLDSGWSVFVLARRTRRCSPACWPRTAVCVRRPWGQGEFQEIRRAVVSGRRATSDRLDTFTAEPEEAERRDLRCRRSLNYLAARELARLFDHLVREPLRYLVDELGKTRYIGPLREIPPRNYVPPRCRDDSRWASGLGAWDRLHSCEDALVQETSRWLADPGRLDAGVRLERQRYREVSESAVSEGRMEGTLGKASPKTRRQLDQLPTHSRLVIVPNKLTSSLGPTTSASVFPNWCPSL